jgi:cell division protease FtsH
MPPDARPPRPSVPPDADPPPGLPLGSIAMIAATVLLGLWLWQQGAGSLAAQTISYRDFKQHLADGDVSDLRIGSDEIEGTLKAKAAPAPAPPSDTANKTASAPTGTPFRTTRVDDPQLLADVERAKVDYRGTRSSPVGGLLLAWLLPLGLLVVFWLVMARRSGMGPGGAVVSFGRSRAKLVADRDVGVTFADVAGCDEAKLELAEIVQFLREPGRFTGLGAKIPKGVLLVGPPGTGKTLLARAVAGEARVPFYSLSGSDFVEMFVGVGAARVRDLFEQAKQHAPCIVFVDELDAIGRARGVHLSTINDEREHTLNQLLVEMDGFEPNSGVVLLAATNRPDVLDPALLRPGRFDRQVVLDAPDVVGREAILRVHARGKSLAPDVDLHHVARATPGFSGADLANALNEGALLAARRGHDRIGAADVDEAVEKVVAGPERKSRRLADAEKRRIAVHEAGHALIAVHSPLADPVQKISIVPRGRAALGYTLQLPTGDRHLLAEAALRERLCGALGGRAAEDVVFGEVSTGAENDLELATALARRMVCQFGMGKSAGLMHVGREEAPFATGPGATALLRDCSEATAHAIDEEVRGLLDEAYAAARALLVAHRDQLDRIAAALLERENLDRDALYALLAPPPPTAAP